MIDKNQILHLQIISFRNEKFHKKYNLKCPRINFKSFVKTHLFVQVQ